MSAGGLFIAENGWKSRARFAVAIVPRARQETRLECIPDLEIRPHRTRSDRKLKRQLATCNFYGDVCLYEHADNLSLLV